MESEKNQHLYHLLVEEKEAHQVLNLLMYYRKKNNICYKCEKLWCTFKGFPQIMGVPKLSNAMHCDKIKSLGHTLGS